MKKIDQLDLLPSTFLLIFYKAAVRNINCVKSSQMIKKVSESYLLSLIIFVSFSKADWDLNMEKKLRSSYDFFYITP